MVNSVFLYVVFQRPIYCNSTSCPDKFDMQNDAGNNKFIAYIVHSRKPALHDIKLYSKYHFALS